MNKGRGRGGSGPNGRGRGGRGGRGRHNIGRGRPPGRAASGYYGQPGNSASPGRGNNSRYGNNPGKKDGEKGASAHTVSEEYRIQLTQILMDLREDDDKMEITMPSDLTNTQRKFCHELARQLGLKSKSSGKGEERRIRVSKVQSGNSGGMMGSVSTDRKNPDALPTEEDYKSIPRISVGRRGEEALRKHLLNFPPTEEETCESMETGSSLMKKRKEASGQFEINVPTPTDSNTLNPPYEQRQRELASQRRDRHERLVQQRIQYHEQAQKQTKASPQYKQMMKQRRKLPAFSYAQDICNVLRNPKNQVIILTGDTGCGKSTQVPQFLLDDSEIGATANILVTQPRRISAISVAERVASERCEQAGQTVGYSVRLESCHSKRTQLLFMTPG